MDNTIFYLIGATPEMRSAIAAALAAATGAKVVDAKDIYAPIFNVIEHDRIADLPEAAWAEIDAVRAAVLRSIETLSPKDWSFVFTHAGLDIPADAGVYRTVQATAEKRGARFVPVTLVSDPQKKLLTFDEADAVAIDSVLAPEEAVARILAAAGG
jgi:hypothetical protein